MFSAFVVSISFPLFLCACWIEVACETTCRCIKLLRESTHGKQTETDHKSCNNMCEHVHPSDCAAFLSCPTQVNQVSRTCSRSKNCHLLTHNRVQASPPSADSMAQDNFGSLAEIARIADAEEALATMVEVGWTTPSALKQHSAEWSKLSLSKSQQAMLKATLDMWGARLEHQPPRPGRPDLPQLKPATQGSLQRALDAAKPNQREEALKLFRATSLPNPTYFRHAAGSTLGRR